MSRPDRLDLHDCDGDEALEEFVRWYEGLLKARKRKGELVHGYGSAGTGGILGIAFERFLEPLAREGVLDYGSGEAVGNPGATWIRPRSPLPASCLICWKECLKRARGELAGLPARASPPAPSWGTEPTTLERAVLRYCATPRPLHKIQARYSRMGNVRETLETLLQRRRIKRLCQAGETLFVVV